MLIFTSLHETNTQALKNTCCSFRHLSHTAYLEAPASIGRPLWWRSYHFSRPKSIPKSPRPYLIVSSFRPRNWIRCFRTCTVFKQEIIKVREWIPHIGPLTKVIPLKLFLDIVPSSSEDVTRAMRGQPKRFSRSYRRRNGGNAIFYVLISFHSRDVLCADSRLFVRPAIRLFCVRLAVHFLAIYSILGSLIQQRQRV